MVSMRLSKGIKLRRERFGGIAFDSRNGTTVDLDRGAFRILEATHGGVGVARETVRELIVSEGLEQVPVPEFDKVLAELVDLRLIEETGSISKKAVHLPKKAQLDWPLSRHLVAPEAVHWAITYKCNAKCPDCYIARYRERELLELDTSRSLEVADRIADWGAFQLAIGGGEPFLRHDLPLVVARAKKRGLAVHVTTGLTGISFDAIEATLPHINHMQIGIQHESLLCASTGDQQKLLRVMKIPHRYGIKVGANLVLCKTVLRHFNKVFEKLLHLGFTNIVLLRYKPPSSVSQWKRECPLSSEMTGFEDKLGKLIQRNPSVDVRVDCGLSFLQRCLQVDVARKAGIRGCVAGSRIAAVGPEGAIYPCSQFHGKRFNAGNILTDDIRKIWEDSEIIKNFRNFRLKSSFTKSECGKCVARLMCGGCRAMSGDAMGTDSGCPESKFSTCPPFPEWLRNA